MSLRACVAGLAAAAALAWGPAALAQEEDEADLGPEAEALIACAVDGASADDRRAITQLAFAVLSFSPQVSELWRIGP